MNSSPSSNTTTDLETNIDQNQNLPLTKADPQYLYLKTSIDIFYGAGHLRNSSLLAPMEKSHSTKAFRGPWCYGPPTPKPSLITQMTLGSKFGHRLTLGNHTSLNLHYLTIKPKFNTPRGHHPSSFRIFSSLCRFGTRQ
jgi:hypothetical protein